MSAHRRIDRVCYPVLLVSVSASVVIVLIGTWSEIESVLLRDVLFTALTLALGSGFVLSATRVVSSNSKHEE